MMVKRPGEPQSFLGKSFVENHSGTLLCLRLFIENKENMCCSSEALDATSQLKLYRGVYSRGVRRSKEKKADGF